MIPFIVTDISYFIASKRKALEWMKSKGKDTAALESEIKTLEGFSEILEDLITENNQLAKRIAEVQIENKELQKYRNIAIGVSAARRWAVATGRKSAKLLQMLEENPAHFEQLYEDLRTYDDNYHIFLDFFERTKDYYNEEDRRNYVILCERGGFEPERRLSCWKFFTDKNRRKMSRADELREGREMTETWIKLIPELKELFR